MGNSNKKRKNENSKMVQQKRNDGAPGAIAGWSLGISSMILGGILFILSGSPLKTVAEASRQEWKSVVYAYRDPANGEGSLKANGYLLYQLGQPREFRLLGVCRYDSERRRWLNITKRMMERATTLKPQKRDSYSSKTDEQLVRFDSPIGLYLVEWMEDTHHVSTTVFSGPVQCNDIDIGEPPKGFIAACVPFPRNGTAMFVPDPEIECKK